jgi:hypothetical protein
MATTIGLLLGLPGYHKMKSLIGSGRMISILIFLTGCQAALPPEQVTTAFWEAMIQGNFDSAKKYSTQATQQLVVKQQNLEDAAVKTGAVLIDGANATVSTVIMLKKPDNSKVLSFDTVLLKEHELWKVDYQRTLNNLLNLPFGDIFKSLQGIGKALNQELGQQIPLFENQIKSFSEELIRQLDELRRQLEKPSPPEKQKTNANTI